ncbi:retrovirus-related pol polyprotein from transposon TNT 1-94, partial [Tanacetum coccineum]
VSESCTDKKADSSTEQLLITLIEEAQLPLNPTPKKAPMIPKPFKECKYYGFNDHHSDNCEYYPRCEVCGSIAHEPADYPKKHPTAGTQGLLTSNPHNPLKSRFTKGTNLCENVCAYLPKEVLKWFLEMTLQETWEGYDLVNCNGITFTRVAYVNGLKHNLINISQLCDANFKVLFTKTWGTIFNQNDKAVLIAPRRRNVYVIDMSSFNKESNVYEYSRYTWVFCLKKKSDAADCIMSFIRKIENLNEVKVKELRSNNGTEFKNHKLEEFCDEKGISQNFSSPCTPEQNGVAERRNKTLIEAARTMLNSAKLPKQFWGEAVNTACYTQNRSIIVKRHGKTAYDVFRGRSPDISYFHVFGCPVHIHNHRDHLGKFDEMADDVFFLGYSLLAKAFRLFNIRRQEMKEIVHVTFSEDDEAISQSSTEGDAINFNENRSFPDDEFLEPRSKVTQCSANIEYFPYIPPYENTTPTDSPILQDFASLEEPPEFTSADDHPTFNEHNHFESGDNLELAKI